MKKTILIPVDFSKVGNIAIAHAAGILETTKGDLLLFRVVKDSKELFNTRRKMNNLRAKVQNQYQDLNIKSLLRIGDFFESVGHAALENNAELIVMGTHGLKGLQFITGSRALKVVSNSEVPIIIVQNGAKIKSGYKNILVPMTLDKNSKQKLTYARHLAQYFNSKIFLIAPNEKDEFSRNKIERDLNFSKQYFDEANVSYEAEINEDIYTLNSYIDYAEEKEIDLIVFMNQPESAFILFDDRVQRVITNRALIPVLLINPRTTSFVTIFGNYSGQG